jgi:hypothetical protein
MMNNHQNLNINKKLIASLFIVSIMLMFTTIFGFTQWQIAQEYKRKLKEVELIAKFQEQEAISWFSAYYFNFENSNFKGGYTPEESIYEGIYSIYLNYDKSTYDYPLNELVSIIEKSCPEAQNLAECEEWSEKLFGELFKTLEKLKSESQLRN